MQTKPWFIDWFNSTYYHQLYFKHDDAEAATFINKLVNYLNPCKEARVLDVACGRGRHSRILAAKEFHVTGIDLSTDSIREAKKYESEQLQFFVHDMRLPFWINYFDYAFNFYTSFGYFNTRREHDNAIRTIAQSLKTNGIFVLDYLNVSYAEEHLASSSQQKTEEVTYNITRWFDETHFFKKIIIEDKGLEKPVTFQEKVTKFSLNDFDTMLSHHQLHIQKVFGDYNFVNYDIKKSPRMIIISKKM